MRASLSRVFGRIYLISVLAAFIIALPAQGSAESKKATITVMKPGDLWLDDMQYTKVARGQRDGTWGYDVTYVVPGIGEKVLFWPRSKIDLDGSAPNKYRVQFMPRGKGRLLLPDRITTRSLPEVYRAILLLEGSYTKEARGNMIVAEAFATVTGLAAGLPGRAAAGVASRPAASSAATRAPIKPTVARPTAAKPTAAKPAQAKPTAKPATATAGGASNATGSLSATEASVADKLNRYLLNPAHPVGGPKAKWFQEALGFTRANADDLAKQIVFDASKAVQTAVTKHGTKFNQVISITGANGRVIGVTFAWIRNNDGVVRLVTGIPTKL